MTSGLDRKCEQHGCAKVCLDPNLHAFDDCFGSGCKFGDIDGAVERRGFILWMEWKLHLNQDVFEHTHRAQLLQARHFTKNSPKQTFVIVVGCPQIMRVDHFRVMHGGEWIWKWFSGTGEFRNFLRYWFHRADAGKPIECRALSHHHTEAAE